MASGDHQLLAQYVKNVHSNLRKDASILGPEEAWQAHCQKKSILSEYAKCMEQLATTHWETNHISESSAATSRIEWTANYCYNYFLQHEYKNYAEKENTIAEKLNKKLEFTVNHSDPLKLIDVGSCYNPFKKFPFFDIIAIDLYPANDSVYQCDFLNVPIGSANVVENSTVLQLKGQEFDVVTFCFLLEYLPSSELRVSACEKAYSLLKPGGLLLISTPDSKHVGANAKIMKCWRYTLAKIGFNRIKYEKYKHMHCMAFRRTLHKEVAQRWALLHHEPYMEHAIHIPQDFNNVDSDKSDDLPVSHSSDVHTELAQMPFSNEINLFNTTY